MNNFYVLMSVLADAQPDFGTYAPLINLGAVGVICFVLIVFARTTVADLRAQRDKAQDALAETQMRLLTDVVPTLTRTNDVMAEALAEIRSARAERR